MDSKLFAELLDAANTSDSSIQTLEKHKVVEVFVRDVPVGREIPVLV